MIMTTMTEENIATVDALLTTSITPVVINIFSMSHFIAQPVLNLYSLRAPPIFIPVFLARFSPCFHKYFLSQC